MQSLPNITETRAGFRKKRDPAAGSADSLSVRSKTIAFPIPRQRFPRAAHDRRKALMLYEALMSAWQGDPDATVAWLMCHWRHANFETPTLRFDTTADATTWLDFLLALTVEGGTRET